MLFLYPIRRFFTLLSKLILNAFLFTRPMEMTGILRYKVDFQSLQADEPLDDFDLDDY